eukprot:3234747-Rhodomonas_salina.1
MLQGVDQQALRMSSEDGRVRRGDRGRVEQKCDGGVNENTGDFNAALDAETFPSTCVHCTKAVSGTRRDSCDPSWVHNGE